MDRTLSVMLIKPSCAETGIFCVIQINTVAADALYWLIASRGDQQPRITVTS